MCVFVCVCVSMFLHDNSKSNRSRNMKLDYVVVYETISDKYDIARKCLKHCYHNSQVA